MDFHLNMRVKFWVSLLAGIGIGKCSNMMLQAIMRLENASQLYILTNHQNSKENCK